MGPSEPLEAIILGGGKAAPDAEQVLGLWPLPWGAEVVRPAPGFPKAVESSTIAGLNPGFHIVVLGFCSPDAAPGLVEAVRWVFPGTYTRTVTGVEAACPQVASSVQPRTEETVERDGLSLDGMLWELSPTRDTLVVMLLRKEVALQSRARTFVSERVESPEGFKIAETCGRPDLAQEGGALVVGWECSVEYHGCCQGGPEACPKVTRYNVDYRSVEGRIESSEHATVTEYESTCGE